MQFKLAHTQGAKLKWLQGDEGGNPTVTNDTAVSIHHSPQFSQIFTQQPEGNAAYQPDLLSQVALTSPHCREDVDRVCRFEDCLQALAEKGGITAVHKHMHVAVQVPLFI